MEMVFESDSGCKYLRVVAAHDDFSIFSFEVFDSVT